MGRASGPPGRLSPARGTGIEPGASNRFNRNASWNGSLAPGAQTTFGFLAGGAGANLVPVVACAAT
ncbi:hypothetical protein FXF50_10575 [Micromonospora sp. AP08]|nr:hypothetical protein FXF50_10575 [Micromonospora sp. AP08]